MPHAEVHVSRALLADTLFGASVNVVRVARETEHDVVFVIEGEQLPRPKDTGKLRQVWCHITEHLRQYSFKAVD